MNLHQKTALRGFEAVPELLRRAGVNTVFGLLGGSNAAWVAQGRGGDDALHPHAP
jgi:hypothetical protein